MSASLSPDGLRCLAATSDHRLALHAPSATAPVTRFAEKQHLQSAYSSAPAWGRGALVAIGTDRGAVTVWDTARAEVVARLSAATAAAPTVAGAAPSAAAAAAHSSAVRSVVWAPAEPGAAAVPSRLYSCAEGSGSVVEWELKPASDGRISAALVRSMRVDKKGLTRLCVSHDACTLFCAGGGGGDSIFVVDLATGQRAHRLQGHSLPITGLALSADSQVFVSSADERNIHLWDLRDPATVASLHAAAAATSAASPGATAAAAMAAVAPTCVLLHPGRPLPDSVSVLKCKGGLFHVACVGEDGVAHIWRYKRAAKADAAAAASPTAESFSRMSAAARRPLMPGCVLRAVAPLHSAQQAAALNAEVPVVVAVRLSLGSGADAPSSSSSSASASTAAGVEAFAVVAHVVVSPLASPSFYAAPYTAEGGASLNLLPKVSLAVLPTQQGRDEAQAQALSRKKAAAQGGDWGEGEGEGEDREGDEAAADGDGDAAMGGAGLRASRERDANNSGEAISVARPLGTAGRSVRDETAPVPAPVAAVGKGKKRARGAEGEEAAVPPAAPAAIEGAEDDADVGGTLGQRISAVIAALRDPARSDLIAASPPVPAQSPVPASASSSSSSSAAVTAQTVAQALLSPTGSLATVLAQALQARDDTQLELVLSQSSEAAVVRATVARLPTPLVLPFLTRVVARFQAKPARAQPLLVWVRAVLVQHTGYLLLQPSLAASLEALYTAIDSRVGVYKKLLRLSGRLDLLLAQTAAAPAAAGARGARAQTLRRSKLAVTQRELEERAARARTVVGGSGGGEGEDDEDDEDEEDDEEEDDEEGEAEGEEAEDRGDEDDEDDDEDEDEDA